MRKILALLLAALFVASALASCTSSPKASFGANIRVTSSDAQDAAAWLAERLGDKLTGKIVIGTDAEGLGADVSTLEDDGYIIRAAGGEVALLARTPEGLDRAVRKYAKAVEAGDPIANELYHDGARIEKMTIAGNDLSEYAITVEGEWEYLRRWTEVNAASSLSALLEIATGVKVPVGGDAPHKIIFRGIKDESFKWSSYHYYVKDGDLVIEYTDTAGARNGALMFLEEECG
ncbi:MAG: hypothetical protein IKX91_00580, partial [Firmicutes bacterium]|nr:hypothetical protein [Bacillota bacterium]